MDGTVADQPEVAHNEVFVLPQVFGEVERAGFLFAFKEEADVGFVFEPEGLDRVEGNGHRHDGSFVVGTAAGVETPVGIVSSLFEGEDLIVPIAEFGEERLLCHPVGGVDGLAVVVGVKINGARGTGSLDFAEHDGGVILDCKQAGGDAALLKHLLDGGGIAAEVREVGRDIGNCEQSGEFFEDRLLPGEDVVADRIRRR